MSHKTSVLLLAILAGCGESGVAPPSAAPASAPERSAEPPAPPEPTAHEAVVPLAEVRATSGCAFESLEALCTGLREHYGSSDEAWTSEGCAFGALQSSTGRFAEARLVSIHSGDGRAADAPIVERPLLGSTVRGPAADEVSTNVLLAARVGEAWFPIHLFHPLIRTADVEPSRFLWHLDEDGSALEWTDGPATVNREDPHGSGRVERTLAVVEHGVPVIAAQATIEIWQSDLDLECSRACHGEPSPPASPGCELRCTSRARGTRAWERVGGEVRIGATTIERTGAHGDAIEIESREASTVRLRDASPEMRFCAFLRVVRALPRTSRRTDAASIALLDRAGAILAAGGGRRIPGTLESVHPAAPRSIVAIDATIATGCGGGGCSTSLVYRTLDGPFPEEGVHYFEVAQREREPIGCAPGGLPSGIGPTLIEVAPFADGDALACGFSGWDGTAERHWVILRVLQ